VEAEVRNQQSIKQDLENNFKFLIMISFGPIPSRRLGKSLGINNVPSPKICSYSCIYCQVGLTNKFSINRECFYEPVQIFREVKKHLQQLEKSNLPDYLTFVANGEPTLDVCLGESIQMLKNLRIPVAVITNASLIGDQKVREDLKLADWVSVKVDTADFFIWKRLNRPHHDIEFNSYLKGLSRFAAEFKGKLATETMLVAGINDSTEALGQTAALISQIQPDMAYIAIPTRPPAVKWVKAPDELVVNESYHIFNEKGLKTELILGFEGSDTGYTGNAREDILNICAVHPIREDTMLKLLAKNHADFSLPEQLIQEQKISQLSYKSMKYYLRKYGG
jgi:wyosine [tRNA(Phe)-imidazoG37] synthetase (radical SAM superfamily)